MSSPSFGPPPPVVELKVEQQFKLRQIEDALRDPETRKEDIITIFMALQKQCFILGNNVSNLISKWPLPTAQDQATTSEETFKFGNLFGTKD